MSRVAVILGALLISGCASNLTADEREYQRVEWLETEFKPMVAACEASPSHSLYYDGPQNRRLRQMMRTGDYSKLRRLDGLRIHCVDTDQMVQALQR